MRKLPAVKSIYKKPVKKSNLKVKPAIRKKVLADKSLSFGKIEDNTPPVKEEKINYSEPFYIQIQNTSDQEKEFRLFGFNRFNGVPNFGNEECVKVTSLNFLTYATYFNNSGLSKKKISKFRFESSTRKNLSEVLYHHKDNFLTGTYIRRELKIGLGLDAYQFQSTVIDINKTWKINAKTYLSGKIAAHSTLVICIFFHEKGMQAPRLSGKNITPVIIQSSFQSAPKKTLKTQKGIVIPKQYKNIKKSVARVLAKKASEKPAKPLF